MVTLAKIEFSERFQFSIHSPLIAPDSPWGRCFVHFFRHLYSRSQSRCSVQNYYSTLHTFFAQSANGGPPKSPEAYTREDVLAYLYSPLTGIRNRGKQPSPGTINARLAHISSFYRFASTYTTGEDLHPLFDGVSPAAGLSPGRAQRVYRQLTFSDLERLFSVIPTTTIMGLRDRAIFLMYLWTARRRSEIGDLRWGDLEEGIIVEPDGSRRSGWFYHFRGKGRKMIDDIAEMPLPAKEALDRYLAASGRAEHIRPESPLFVATGQRSRERPLDTADMGWRLKCYARAAGLDTSRVTLHSFRHTAARLRYEAGSPLRDVSNLLRHSSLATTDIYLAELTSSADPGAKLLEAKLRKFNL